jgi:pimeloyl-ACP methyl ester carboxylesterase
MTLEQRIRTAEADLFAAADIDIDESVLQLAQTGLKLRTIAHGSGPPVLLLHGVSLNAAAWWPLFKALPDYRLFAVELPGHGLSDPVAYRPNHVREHARLLIDDILDALKLDCAPVIAHSLGGMFALWYAATGANRISSLVALGDPAVALPGVTVRMPLSLLTIRGLGPAILRTPNHRAVYRRLLAQGLGTAEVAASPGPLLQALQLAGRRAENAHTIASLMHAINRPRRPRPESVLNAQELASIQPTTLFIWGTDDPYLPPREARPSTEKMPSATLVELPAGHAPWLVHPERTAQLVRTHLAANMGSVRSSV